MRKKRQATHKTYKKNEQSTVKKDILRKTSRQAVQNSANNAKKRQATLKAYKKTSKKTQKMRNQRQRKTYYVKQTAKPRENPIYNAEM